VLPWFAHDALVHYLAPRGLEQYTGGGWGSRDVCQGPVELLLALGRPEPVRDLLVRVFSQQNADGDWPQWFTFFARERNLRGPDSHGDIVFWPLLALAEYLAASDDFGLLDETLPYFHVDGDARAERGTLLDHVQRALALIASRAIPGTSLTAYGHGDWNDTLQPVDRTLAAELCSAWTVTLHYQSFTALSDVLGRAGRDDLAGSLDAIRARIRDDFQRLLVVDDVLAGFARFPAGGEPEPWLHPRDTVTGIRYSVLAMIHAVLAGLFTREQAERHAHLIEQHLLGSDGVRLFDQPIPYRGGPERHFRRAESSPFFGREVGLMYMHAHLRYAEALARLGRADAFFLALQQANPAGLRDVLRNARPRQANCYTSSSDAELADRYEASANYQAVRSGDVAVEGGWRVYSSGPGIAVRLVRECLLGLRLQRSSLGIDPVMPARLDGTLVRTVVAGREIRVRYAVGPRGFGPTRLTLNGTPLSFTREHNAYREGGAVVAMDMLHARLGDGPNELVIELG
jgi:cellobiose phosphorylase